MRLNAMTILRILSLGFIGIIVILSTFPIGDGDFFWHVKTGQWIWQHKALPSFDPFSFTIAQFPLDESDSGRVQFILRQYWLAQLFFYGLWNTTGEAGMVLMRAVSYAGILSFLFWWTRKETDPFTSLVTIFLIGNVLLGYPNERPQIFGFIALPILLCLLEQVRLAHDPLPRRLHILLPLVMLLWANCHGSFLVGIGAIGLYLLADLLKCVSSREPIPWKTVVLLSTSILAATLNPNGLRAIMEIFTLSGAYKDSVTEYISPIKLALQEKVFDYYYWSLVLAVVAILIARRKSIAPAHILLLLFLLLLSLTGVRYIPFFVLATPLLCQYVPPLPGREWLKPVLAIILLVLWGTSIDYRNVLKFRAEKSFPVAATRFLAKVRPESELFNHIAWGGYLMCYAPDYKVFVDGRGLLVKLVAIHDKVLSGYRWGEILDASGVNTIMIPGTHDISGETYPLIRRLSNDPQWFLIYRDDVALIYVRDVGRNRDLIARYAMDKATVAEHIKARWRWQFAGER